MKPGRGPTVVVSTSCEHAEDPSPFGAVEDVLTGTAREERGARIRDDAAGLVYEATVTGRDGRTWLTGLTILSTDPERRPITREVLRRVPVDRIAEQVAMELVAQEAWAEREPTFTEDGREVIHIRTPGLARRGRHDRPTDAELIADVRAGMGRQQIATKYRAALSTVDNWLSPLRDSGAIPRRKPGRPRITTEGDE